MNPSFKSNDLVKVELDNLTIIQIIEPYWDKYGNLTYEQNILYDQQGCNVEFTTSAIEKHGKLLT